MRLTPEQVAAIKSTVAETLGGGADVVLFGSRVDDTQRGGDIDLLLIPPVRLDADAALDARLKILAGLHRALGERRVDLVLLRAPDPRMTAFHTHALETGIRL